MQSDAEFADERDKIFLACVRHFLEIDSDARVFVRLRVLDKRGFEMLTRGGIRRRCRRGWLADFLAWSVLEERHHRQLDVQGFQPGVELGVFVDGQTSVGGEGVEFLGNQQVDIVIVKLERSEAVRVPVDVKCRAQRIISSGKMPKRRLCGSVPAGNWRALISRSCDAGERAGSSVRAAEEAVRASSGGE